MKNKDKYGVKRERYNELFFVKAFARNYNSEKAVGGSWLHLHDS